MGFEDTDFSEREPRELEESGDGYARTQRFVERGKYQKPKVEMGDEKNTTTPPSKPTPKASNSHTVSTVLGIIWTIAVIIAPADIIGGCHGSGWNAGMFCTGPGALEDLAIRAGLIAAWWVVAWFIRN